VKKILCALILFSSLCAFADEQPSSPRDFSCGVESGWNSYTGILGGRLEYRALSDFALNAGFGVGIWGFRPSLGMRYYLSYPYGLALGAGAAYNTGAEKYDQKVMTEDAAGTQSKQTVTFVLKPTTVINLTALYAWKTSNGDRLYLELGWGFPLDSDPYRYTIKTGNTLTKGERKSIRIGKPGGLIVALGYSFF
jgi:hypothetical protein